MALNCNGGGMGNKTGSNHRNKVETERGGRMNIILALIAANIPTFVFCIGGIYLMAKGHDAAGWACLIVAMIGARSYKIKGQSE